MFFWHYMHIVKGSPFLFVHNSRNTAERPFCSNIIRPPSPCHCEFFKNNFTTGMKQNVQTKILLMETKITFCFQIISTSSISLEVCIPFFSFFLSKHVSLPHET